MFLKNEIFYDSPDCSGILRFFAQIEQKAGLKPMKIIILCSWQFIKLKNINRITYYYNLALHKAVIIQTAFFIFLPPTLHKIEQETVPYKDASLQQFVFRSLCSFYLLAAITFHENGLVSGFDCSCIPL